MMDPSPTLTEMRGSVPIGTLGYTSFGLAMLTLGCQVAIVYLQAACRTGEYSKNTSQKRLLRSSRALSFEII